MKSIGIIPARYGSTRFEGKPLVDLCAKTMIRRVWEGANESKLLNRIIIATDDERIADECRKMGADFVLSQKRFVSGTDRIADAYVNLGEKFDIVVNIQGDEPLLHGNIIDDLVCALENSSADVATPVKKISAISELENPTIVKVVMNSNGMALYFSRSPIPHIRGDFLENWLEKQEFWKHIGLYAYKTSALSRFVNLPPSPLEIAEQLEQLRLLEDGAVYQCVKTEQNLIAIDTPEDAEKVRSILENKISY